MKKKKEINGWKIGIAIILILQCVTIILLTIPYWKENNPKPKYSYYSYRTQIIELKNNNFGASIYVTEYTCDEGVYVNNLPNQNWFYASTWQDGTPKPSTSYGKCFIKIREEKLNP